MRLPDTTQTAPTRRMCVVAADLRLPAGVDDGAWAALVEEASAAALLAAKSAPGHHPGLHQALLTDAFMDAHREGATSARLGFTVQAHARASLAGHAHAGLGAALAKLLAALPGAQADHVRTVQDVAG